MTSGSGRFSVRATVPAGATTILKRGGRPIATRDGGVLDHDDGAPGVYRVEVHVSDAPGSAPVPWLLSNPVYRFAVATAEQPPASSPLVIRGSTAPFTSEAWRVETSTGSSATVATEGGEVSLSYHLGDAEASPFAALAAHLHGIPDGANQIVFRGRAARPMRVSAQLRFAVGEARWTRSVYLDTSDREVTIPIESMRPAEAPRQMPPLSTATSLLVVVDLTNARPGEQGSFTLADAALREVGSPEIR